MSLKISLFHAGLHHQYEDYTDHILVGRLFKMCITAVNKCLLCQKKRHGRLELSVWN